MEGKKEDILKDGQESKVPVDGKLKVVCHVKGNGRKEWIMILILPEIWNSMVIMEIVASQYIDECLVYEYVQTILVSSQRIVTDVISI